MRREHIVPLSRQVKDILMEVRAYSGMSKHVFLLTLTQANLSVKIP